MARNGSPANSRYGDGPRSPIAGPIPQSKRDKRRTVLKDRLMEMMDTFSKTHQEHYYAQLIGLQCDMNLIMRADSYANVPLDDDPEHIARMLAEAQYEATRGRGIRAEGAASFNAYAGRYYSKLVTDINGALERRDADLTLAHNHYHESLDDIRRTQQYKTQLAHEEHRILVQTIRERLIQQTVRRKERLIREKEQLDIGDSSALLLNPSQFSIGNPASPGGPQNPRKTRNTRLRPDEDGYGVDPMKRKRKAPADEGEYESPAPNVRGADVRSTPYKDAKAKAFYNQQEAPLLSISNLFTEKELAFNLTQAHAEANGFFARARALAGNTANGSSNGLNGTTPADGPSAPFDAADSAVTDPTTALLTASPSLAPILPVHATRSSRLTNPLNDLAAAAITTAPFYATVPAIPTTTAKGNPPHAPSLPGISDTEVNSDLAMMKLDLDDPLIAKLAERCVERAGALAMSDGEATGGVGVKLTGLNGTGAGGNVGVGTGVANAAAVMMQRQESGMGLGLDLGGAPMVRERSLGGGSEVGEGISAADFGARAKSARV